MPDVPPNEYINSLLIAYEHAEKYYNQAVSDVIAAEIRRDEARKIQEDALKRLEDAREIYGTIDVKKDVPWSDITTNVTTSPTEGHGRPPTVSPTRNTGTKPVRRKPIKKAIAESESTRRLLVEKTQENVVNSDVEDSPEAPQADKRQSIVPPDIILSPTAGQKKAPKIFLTSPESPRKRLSIVPLLFPMDEVKGVLKIAQGRNREWFDKNFDCEAHGLVKRFYQATFSTKTNEKTKKVTVKTIVLNDEGNELVTDTSQIQEMYIGKSSDNGDPKPTFRDRAAEALVNPLQQDPLALFFAPKNALRTNEIYYVGHWKVVDGEMLQPPLLVKGQLQQCLARFAFVGIDRKIVDAINKGT